MAIDNIQQLKDYVDTLPWYKKIFFPGRLLAALNDSSLEKQSEALVIVCFSALYTQIRTSIFWPFYNWLFPDLGGLGSFCQKKAETTPSGIALIVAIRGRKDEHIKEILNLPIDDRPDSTSLINAIRFSIKQNYYEVTYNMLQQEQIYDETIVSGALNAAVEAQEWDAIGELTRQGAYKRLDTKTCNNVVLLTARAYKLRELTYLLEREEIAQKITITTMNQVLSHLMAPGQYEWDSDLAPLKNILKFVDVNGAGLSMDALETAYLHAIKNGRVGALKVLQAQPGIPQPPMESIIHAVIFAAQNRRYEMVLHLIQTIPKQERLAILQTKALINSEHHSHLDAPEKTHILQWAVGRSVPQDIQAILDALDEQDRFVLITNTPNENGARDISPLSLTAAMGAKSNMIMLLNTMSHAQLMEAILPKKVSLTTPLCKYEAREIIIPVLLEKIFGKNQKLHNAYNYLVTKKIDRSILEDMRDYYLANHFPSSIQKKITFFKSGFSIPGHKLSNDELDKVVRFAFYQRYDDFDCNERKKIEERMDEYERSVKVVAPVAQAGSPA